MAWLGRMQSGEQRHSSSWKKESSWGSCQGHYDQELPEQQDIPKTWCFLKEGLLQVRAEIAHFSSWHMGRTMASNFSRLDMFPGETQEKEADHLDRCFTECVKRVENRSVGEIWVPHKDNVQCRFAGASKQYPGRNSLWRTEFRPEKGVVVKAIF